MVKYSVTYLIGVRVYRTEIVVETFEDIRRVIASRRKKSIDSIAVISLIVVAVEH